MEPLEELKSLRWVEEAEETGNGYKLTSRPKTLKTELTHTIRKGSSLHDSGYSRGKELDTPRSLLLPQYHLHLYENGFSFTLKNKPRTRSTIGMIPTYWTLEDRERWNHPTTVCYGNGDMQKNGVTDTRTEYNRAKSWREKAIIAAVYLQSAEPHYGETWYRTAYAYRLRLVGKKMLEPEVKKVQTTDAARFLTGITYN